METLQLLHPACWKDYQLIDSGDGEKLERFGKYTLIRPEPQALWTRSLSEKEWHSKAVARFAREQKDRFRFTDEVKGGWKKFSDFPDSWTVDYHHDSLHLQLRLALTGFGHVGIFPEQGENWNFIYDAVRNGTPRARVLNLFAYTGAASVAARLAGAEVVHVDASRPGINWANQNMQLNGMKDIRWVHEDALKFVKREARRGNRYHGIIMDPPPYGRGPEGEKWTLQDKLDEIVSSASQLLEPANSFFILSMYAVGLSPLVGLNVVTSRFDNVNPEAGEFYLKSGSGRHLPMGTFVRFRR
jgi:23S rRNA (cytosine1962-C5)-methyltransferase